MDFRLSLSRRAASGGFFQAGRRADLQVQQEHDIEINVAVERTGNHHLAPKRAFAKLDLKRASCIFRYRTVTDAGGSGHQDG